MKEGFFYWSTEYYHHDNTFTMNDYLENFLDNHIKITLDDGSYVEVLNSYTKEKYAIHASGNGDCYNHKVKIVKL